MRARNCASRKLLASASPVEAQLFIQTHAISSYSSARAGRMVGGGMKNMSFRRGKEKAPAILSRGLRLLQSLRSGVVEAIGIHHLGPRRHEVFHKLLLRVRARVDLREGAQLRVRAEDQVDAGAAPLDGLRLAVTALVRVVAGRLHSMPISSRLTKKSFVSVPGLLVRTPCLEPPAFAP